MRCDSCEILYINGVRCHEPGCPYAWRDVKEKCAWCGVDFVPDHRDQEYCDHYCWLAENGTPEQDDDDYPDEQCCYPGCDEPVEHSGEYCVSCWELINDL